MHIALVKRTSLLMRYAMMAGCLVLIMACWMPIASIQPSGGLDPSWIYGCQEAHAQGYTFGSQLIFTFGPYACLYTGLFHPATDGMMWVGSGYLAVCYAGLLLFLVRRSSIGWLVALSGVLGCCLVLRDALFFSYPLLLAFVIYKATLPTERHFLSLRRHAVWGGAVWFFAPLGLLALIKGSFGVASLMVMGTSVCFFLLRKEVRFALIALLVPVGSLVLFWVGAGQPLQALPSFFFSQYEIIRGYTDAMSLRGSWLEWAAYLSASLWVVWAIATMKGIPTTSRYFLMATVGGWLWLLLKAGFVRHDIHMFITASGMLIVTVSLPLIFSDRKWKGFIIVALLLYVWIASGLAHLPYPRRTLFSIATIQGMEQRGGGRLSREFIKQNRALQAALPLPRFEGTTDIYSYDQAFLIASGNQWVPRPVFQSYTLYTPWLAYQNSTHLLSDRAPEHIIFNVQPIDGRLPSLEEGPSWPLLLSNYCPQADVLSPETAAKGYLYLHRLREKNSQPKMVDLGTYACHLGQWEELPPLEGLVMAKIHIQPTYLGRLLSLLHRSSRFRITLRHADGSQITYRLIPGMAEAGFLLSPLVEQSEEFMQLYEGEEALSHKRVTALMLRTVAKGFSCWGATYQLELSRLVRYTNAFKSWECGAAGATDLDPRSDVEAAQLE